MSAGIVLRYKSHISAFGTVFAQFGVACYLFSMMLLLYSCVGVIHRDFTPDNLILSSTGALKLVDFNVAQQADQSSRSIAGKRAYMPPEQSRGKPTTQSDLYALCATIFFLLTGNEPEPLTVGQPSSVKGEISADWDEVVARLTELDLEARFKTAREVSEFIEDELDY